MVGTANTVCVAVEQRVEFFFRTRALVVVSVRRLIPADDDGVEFEEDAFEAPEGVPDLECPAEANGDFEFGGEEIFLRYYGGGGGGGGDEGFDGGVVVFSLGREVEDEEEDAFGVEGEGGGGEVETVEEGQRCCLAHTTLSATDMWIG